jgi:hypothetical protein
MSERGALLFCVPDNWRSRNVWLLFAVTVALVFLTEGLWLHRWSWDLLAMAATWGVMAFLQRRGAAYEKGIQLPADNSGARSRFIARSQTERYHWDGDVLTIVPTSSVMSGADLGRPLLGGVLRVPSNKRSQLENFLVRGPAKRGAELR